MKTLRSIPFILLLALPLTTSITTISQEPISIKFDLLKHKAQELPLKEIMQTALMLHMLQNGKGNQQGNISYKNKKYTLKQLVEIENTIKTNSKTYSNLQQELISLENALANAIAQIQQATKPFTQGINNYKGIIKQLVNKWIAQRKFHDTPLIHWFNLTESQFIDQYITTLAEGNRFVNDLRILLIDVVYTVNPGLAKKLTNPTKKKVIKKDEL